MGARTVRTGESRAPQARSPGAAPGETVGASAFDPQNHVCPRKRAGFQISPRSTKPGEDLSGPTVPRPRHALLLSNRCRTGYRPRRGLRHALRRRSPLSAPIRLCGSAFSPRHTRARRLPARRPIGDFGHPHGLSRPVRCFFAGCSPRVCGRARNDRGRDLPLPRGEPRRQHAEFPIPCRSRGMAERGTAGGAAHRLTTAAAAPPGQSAGQWGVGVRAAANRRSRSRTVSGWRAATLLLSATSVDKS